MFNSVSLSWMPGLDTNLSQFSLFYFVYQVHQDQQIIYQVTFIFSCKRSSSKNLQCVVGGFMFTSKLSTFDFYYLFRINFIYKHINSRSEEKCQCYFHQMMVTCLQQYILLLSFLRAWLNSKGVHKTSLQQCRCTKPFIII